ncbi:MAG: SDR family NAD(P)-dependent oxidoreductase [Solirubrobacterales bacterium]
MDLRIAGRTALVIAASEGLGRAVAGALAREGVNLTIVARREEVLEEAAAQIREEAGVDIVAVPTDITTEEGRRLALEATPVVDILVSSIGGHPPGDFDRFTIEDWRHVVDAMMLTPIELMKATLDGMVERKRWLHHRAEPPDGRRRGQHHLLIGPQPGQAVACSSSPRETASTRR